MKIYPPPEGITDEQLRNGQWQVFADVKCAECGKEHALTNAEQSLEGPRCVRCGGICT